MKTSPKDIVNFIRHTFNTSDSIPLHAPVFLGNEKRYILEAIDSTFVSSVGKFVDEFEKSICKYTGSSFAIATVNGTSALHIALLVSGVKPNDLVITQPLSFIATCNAIRYLGADPLFIDVDSHTLGLSCNALRKFLNDNVKIINGECIHKGSSRRISACVPMHTFGHPVDLDEISNICKEFSILLIEDAAESIGSLYKKKHTGTFGKLGVFSFNGNKTITAGGGGVIITDDHSLADKAKHLTTQAKVAHKWDFVHDSIGYNYRMPNINAALVVAQLEQIEFIIKGKRNLAAEYKSFFSNTQWDFVDEPPNTRSNFWLNSILVKNKVERDNLLEYLNDSLVMSRPAWTLMNKLTMFKNSISGNLSHAESIESRLVNLPSSFRTKK